MTVSLSKHCTPGPVPNIETNFTFFALEDVYTVTDQEEPIYPPDAVPLFPTTIAALAVRFPAKASRLRLNSRLGSRHPAKKRSTARPRHNIHHSYSDYRGPPSLQSTPVKARRHYLCVRWVEAGAKLKVSSYLVHVLRVSNHGTTTFSAYSTCHNLSLYAASPEHFVAA